MEVPSVWDDTKVIKGEIGQFICVARKSNDRWFIASMTNSEERTLEINIDFLKDGENYEMISYSDTEQTIYDAEKIKKENSTIKNGDILRINMAPGGGFAAFLIPIRN